MCCDDSVINISHLTCGDSFYARSESCPMALEGVQDDYIITHFTRDVKY